MQPFYLGLDGKRRTFGVLLVACLLALGASEPATAAGTRGVAGGSIAPVQSTIRSIRDEIQREGYSRGPMASRHDAHRSKR
jgi:hypothetical protein